jgi:hypothetical protein
MSSKSIFITKTNKPITFHNLSNKECPRCFKNFLPKHPLTIYCKDQECLRILWKQKYKKESGTYNKTGKLPLKNCIFCKKSFQPVSLNNKGWCSNFDCKHSATLANKKKTRKTNKSHNKKYYVKKYGLTIEQYEDMENHQNHKCAICNKHDSLNAKDNKGNPKRLFIDHDHDTMQIRGLLCHYCNLALGGFFDNIQLLKNAMRYLIRGRKSNVFVPDQKNILEKNSYKKVV